MNPTEFNSLPITEQAILLWGNGKFVELWHNDIYKIGIYHVEDHIVSVYYDDKDRHKIVRIRMWDNIGNNYNMLQEVIARNPLPRN